MHRFMLLLGLGAALLAAGACAQRPETPLTQAAVRNDVAALRQLLDDGHKADEGGDSWTALIWASRSGSIEAINLLLDSGADVNLPGSTGDNWDATPLQHAILQRQPAAVRLLLDRGADLNRGAGPGSLTPLLLRPATRIPPSSNCCSPTEQTRPSRTKTEPRRCLVRSPPAHSTDPTVRCLAAAASKRCARSSRTIRGFV